MRYLSVCSGIEAATVAWHGLSGWEPVAFSEIEAFPSAVLAHRFPRVKNLGDMTKFKEWTIEPETVDLLVGGTPCQSFSVAGLRQGLEDPRGNLMLTFGAIADHFKPTWLVWENVPGVLSSKGGRDFGSFIGMLQELGYGVSYRVLNAKHFGVPQQRRRVFVVGYFGDWRRSAKVLFEPESLRGDSPPSRGEREKNTGEHAIGIDEECNSRNDLFGPPLRGGQGGTRQAVAYYESHPQDSRVTGPHDTASSVTASYGTGGGNTPLVVHSSTTALSAPSESVFEAPAIIRRLTPAECARLQGFPDDWAQIPWKGRPAQDCPVGLQYKAYGNSMAVPCMKWIGERIQMVQEEGV